MKKKPKIKAALSVGGKRKPISDEDALALALMFERILRRPRD